MSDLPIRNFLCTLTGGQTVTVRARDVAGAERELAYQLGYLTPGLTPEVQSIVTATRATGPRRRTKVPDRVGPPGRRRRSAHEERLATFFAHNPDLPAPVREFRFAAPDRQWRFDFAWPDRGLALEVEGGTFTAGRHTRGPGMAEDARKYNEAALRGWRVCRVTTDMFGRRGEAFEVVRRMLAAEIHFMSSVLQAANGREQP